MPPSKKHIYIVHVLFRFYTLWFIEVLDCLSHFLTHFWCRGSCNNFYDRFLECCDYLLLERKIQILTIRYFKDLVFLSQENLFG